MEYDSCYDTQCPRRETCTLWHNACERLKEGAISVSITNPEVIARAGGWAHCPRWHEYKLRRFARGLMWRYPDMTVRQLDDVRGAIESRFGYSAAVRMRCGYEVISPEEQDIIAELFERYASGHKPKYRSFEEHYIKPARVEGKAVHKLIK